MPIQVPFAPETPARRPRGSDELPTADWFQPHPELAVLAGLRPILREDFFSEYDGRFLTAHLGELPYALTPEARFAFALWDRDERHHCEGFRATLASLYDDFDAREARAVLRRTPDFEPLAELFENEHALLLLAAYDELCTVRAYRRLLPRYRPLGARFVRWVRGVIADEAWHYALFLGALRARHAHRADEAPARIARIRAAEGTPYAATFLLDHDDGDLFSAEVCDQAARIVLRQLAP